MAGRPPKPTSLKLVEGNRGKRASGKQEPDPPYLNDLSAPEDLPPGAKAVWEDIAPKLRQARMLSMVHVPMLKAGCIAFAQYLAASKKLEEQRMVVEEPRKEGSPSPMKAAQLNQWMIAQSMSFKQAMAVFSKFGMSPADQTRLAIQPQGDLFSDVAKDQAQSKPSKYF